MKRIIAAIVVFAMLSVFFGEVKSEDKSINYKVLRYTFPYGTKIKNIDIVPLNVKVTNPINKKFISFRADNFKGDKFFMEYEFPQKWYEYSIGVGIEKGERCIFLTIYFYNTIFSGKKFLHAKDFDIKIDYVLPEKIESLATYDFLIISPDEWINELEALKQHKESKGIKTIVVGLNEIYSGKYFSSYG
ncbi:MAG: C25 family cysteine peptidase, partial [Candidatus Thermoplasmatota archaeon]